MFGRNAIVPTLELIAKNQPRKIFELDGDLLSIGRDHRADVSLRDDRVSSWHARVVRGPNGTFSIEDTDSRNSTFLDGVKLEKFKPQVLKDGSCVRVCEFTLIYHQQIVQMQEDRAEEATIIGMLDDMSSINLASRPDRSSSVLRAVLEINRILGGATDLNALLARALEELFAVFPQVECGFILTVEPDGKLHPRATRERSGEGKTLTLSRSVLDRVLRDKKGLIISDVGSDLQLPVTESLSGSGIRTALCVPILGREGSPIGIIQLDSRAKKVSFASEDLELLAAVSVPISVVVENHRLLKMESLLSTAAEVQVALLPRRRPVAPGYTFWEHYQPALHVGGDYYDYIPLEIGPRGEWLRGAIAIGDVSGKGMPAALLMACFGSEVRHLVRTGAPPEVVADLLNTAFLDVDLPCRFITFVLVILDVRTHTLTMVNAGHFCPLIRRRNGKLDSIGEAEAGWPIGIEGPDGYRSFEAHLDPGDTVVLFTDGATDAQSPRETYYSLEGVQAQVESTEGNAAKIGDALLRSVRAYVEGRAFGDDIAVVCFGRDV
jgi:phosphoserine phosphatase RsbU/P